MEVLSQIRFLWGGTRVKVLKVLWGLLVDDISLASILIMALILSVLAVVAQQVHLAAYIIWIGLLVSLWVSVEHQLKQKLKK